MPRPHRMVDFPRDNPATGKPIGQVAIWVLTQEEQEAANAEAEKVARRLLKEGKRGDLGYEAVFNNEGAVQVLMRACRDPNDVTKPAFPGANAVRERLTSDECGMLFEHYLTVQLELGPIISQMGNEEFKAWVEKLAEGQTFFFDLLSLETKLTLVRTMASQLVTFWTATSSAGLPPEDDEQPSEDAGDATASMGKTGPDGIAL